MKGRRVWIVSHVEVYLAPKDFGADALLCYVASSKASALRLIRATRVDSGTWWRIESGRIDEIEARTGREELYSRKGRPLKSAPLRQGYRLAVSRYRRDLDRIRARLKAGEGPAKILLRTARSMESVLRGHSKGRP